LGITPDRRLKLLDFGLAVALEKGEQATDVYELTGETGSRRYMAPEVCLSQPYGVAVDVYSWAVVAFEIWSLRGKPFSTYSLETHAEKVVVAGERPTMPPTWSSDVKELLACAWRGAVWESTSTPSRSRGQHRVDGVGRPKFDFHTGAATLNNAARRATPPACSRGSRSRAGPTR
jgi:serine/threonine protein kinase